MKDPNSKIDQEAEIKEEAVQEPEKDLSDAETPAQKEPESVSQESGNNSSAGGRRYLMWLLAGGYLIYTAYELCKGVLEGAEGTGPGFLVAGIAFGIIGILMVAAGVKSYMKTDKEKKAAEERQRAENPAPAPAPEKKKSMSIAERARLADRLKDTETSDDDSE